MPGRKVVLATDEFYHIFNMGVASQPVFTDKKSYQRAVETAFYYQNRNLPLRYSHFITQQKEKRAEILNRLRSERKLLVYIIAFCLMPNHFHFLLRQVFDNGISKFLGNFTNSYTRYFNTKNDRQGSLFQGKFKAVRIETEEQLLHVSRYIHLNPYTSYVIKDINGLKDYFYSSLPEYLGITNSNFCHKEDILGYFKNPQGYKDFVFDQADYQRQLDRIKHSVLEV